MEWALTADAEKTSTSIVSRAEVAAAFAKAVRAGLVKGDVARNAQRRFSGDWPDLARVSVTEALVERAERLAWDHGLRGPPHRRISSVSSDTAQGGRSNPRCHPL